MPQESNRDPQSTTSTSSSSQTAKPGGDTSGAASGTANGDLVKAKDALVDGAQQLTGELKSAAEEAAGQAKKAAETKLDAGRDFAAEHLGSVAHALRKTGDELAKSDSALTSYVGQAASAVEDVSSYLQTRTLSQLMGDLEGFARREPAMFLGSSFIAGIMGGRFLKSATPAMPKGDGRRGAYDSQSSSASMAGLPAYAVARSGGSFSNSNGDHMHRAGVSHTTHASHTSASHGSGSSAAGGGSSATGAYAGGTYTPAASNASTSASSSTHTPATHSSATHTSSTHTSSTHDASTSTPSTTSAVSTSQSAASMSPSKDGTVLAHGDTLPTGATPKAKKRAPPVRPTRRCRSRAPR